MDPRLLGYYNQELQHLREMGAEFARQFPKIAARLSMDGIEVADPYVERLLEGAAFLAARVQLKLDSEFPRFTQRLLEIVYPGYLVPTPAMLVARFEPQWSDPNLANGVTIPRGSFMRGQLGKGDVTACEFRTAQDVELWPIELIGAQYFAFAPDLPIAALAVKQRVRGGLRLKLMRNVVGRRHVELDRSENAALSFPLEVARDIHRLAHDLVHQRLKTQWTSFRIDRSEEIGEHHRIEPGKQFR